MSVLIAIALKSLLIAGLTLGLLHLIRKRSAAERSWVAHIGLLALLIMAFAPLVLPSWKVNAPTVLASTEASPIAQPVIVETKATPAFKATSPIPTPVNVPTPSQAVSSRPEIDPIAMATAVYAVPAAILLFITFLALARLVALQARAEVLVDGHWLSALARAQRRMGFKHGTALLTSDELASPISWGLMRPVILLNSRAVEATDEAEAIIAHELAHVARLDWIKLLLARVATALFWFNPLVWLLAREAHQLREETADDTVLAADIADTDYAQLLVGVARHECPGFLLGAHGVAPSKSSLARRVARVLDINSARGPAARGFAFGIFAGALLVAAPLAALTLASEPEHPGSSIPSHGDRGTALVKPAVAAAAESPAVAADLPHIIATGVASSVATAAAAIRPNAAADEDIEAVSQSGASVVTRGGMTVSRSPSGATVIVYPPDAAGRIKTVARAPDGSSAISYADAGYGPGNSRFKYKYRDPDGPIDTAIEMKALSVTPEYVEAMRAASVALRTLPAAAFNGMKAVGVTPDYVWDMSRAGYANLDREGLTQARAVGIDAKYVRSIAAVGFTGLSIGQLTQLRALGVTPADIVRARRISSSVTFEQLRNMKAVGLLSNRSGVPDPPDPPDPPGRRK